MFAGAKIVEKDNGTVTSTKQFVWCPGDAQPCEERDGSNNVTKRFYPQGEQIGSTNYYFTRNHLGSIREMFRNNGIVVARYDYDPWGRSTTVINTTLPDFNFTGLYRHSASNLDMAVRRLYDPDLARWISRDPIGEGGGLNLYAYCGNDPTRHVDPLGLSSLVYDSATGTLTLYTGSGQVVGTYPAGNNTVPSSNGPWPSGTYNYAYHTDHPESGPTGPYGSHGNSVFDVPGRTGMGVHSGRQGPESPTHGCIRTTDPGTAAIQNLNAHDPLTTITVR
ncbi:MAG: hypothetical protein DME49_10775 [Verrucomicrobia bacterium]|nr:MAG: hypothetical protein DME49_10775 [Verrucomicrobiota bacterium]PYL57032.1 MAG: hypothetical protein DMF30_07765 [Verrucomicrobiota bacterium]